MSASNREAPLSSCLLPVHSGEGNVAIDSFAIILLRKTYLNPTFLACFGTAVLWPNFLGLNSGSVGDLLCDKN